MRIQEILIPERFGFLTISETGSSYQEQHKTAHALLVESVRYAIQSGKISGNFSPETLQLQYHAYHKPYFVEHPELHFNLSHCDGLAVCLLSSTECGVDAECRRQVRPGILRKVFTSEEQQLVLGSSDPDLEFTKIWTLKESYVKAIGRGIAYPLHEIAFSKTSTEIVSNQEHAEFYQTVLTDSELVISLCILDEALIKYQQEHPHF